MPIKSYLVHPREGRKTKLSSMLSEMEHCEVVTAENEELLILITETDTKTEEERLKEKLERMEEIKLMAMVSGFDTPKTE